MTWRTATARWLTRWRFEYALAEVGLYTALLPITIILFPDNSLWLALLVLLTGFLNALGALADLLTDTP